MSKEITITVDGVEVKGRQGQTILEMADAAGIYIPRLCYAKDLVACGRCRVCTVTVNGRSMAACTTPATDGMVILNDTAQVNEQRKAVIEMLFVEGNHICPSCEKSGNCELQALAYRFQILVPRFPFMFPRREVDMSHPDVWIDRNRCIQCGRCERASRDLDGKTVFGFKGRSGDMQVTIDGDARLSDTQMAAADRAAEICPTGALLIKRRGFAMPIGQRKFDSKPIGSDIEKSSSSAQA